MHRSLNQHLIGWELEGRYHYSKMFPWEPEGCCCHSLYTALPPFWFSLEHCGIVVRPFWLSTDDLFMEVIIFSGKLEEIKNLALISVKLYACMLIVYQSIQFPHIVGGVINPCNSIFSSTEPKAQEELLASVLVRCVSSVNFLHFHLLENPRPDFTETWQESSFNRGRGFKVVQMIPVQMRPPRAKTM